MRIEKPDDYSNQKVDSILENYNDIENTLLQNEEQQKPTVITIMNESFSDLSVLGLLTCTDEHLKVLHSLRDDPNMVEIGYNYVSTRGGGTSTTEFEFLTGDAISNVNGINPYSVFRMHGVPLIVQQMKSLGYHTIALHPEMASNWRRDQVYKELGFDEFLAIDEFENAERTVWNRVADIGDYKKLIEVYEEQTEPSFIFNITMQNHGGYSAIEELPESDVVAIDAQYSQYTDVQMYQSLINKADKALEYLIEYFRNVDKPVILCFFGDH